MEKIQLHFVYCPGCDYSNWEWREVKIHLMRHHNLEPVEAEELAFEAYLKAFD